jgi:hypothetical protein
MERLHRIEKNNALRTYRLFPYDEIVKALKEDGKIFFANSKGRPLKAGTVWKASKTLSRMMGKKVTVKSGVYKLKDKTSLEGYIFILEGSG